LHKPERMEQPAAAVASRKNARPAKQLDPWGRPDHHSRCLANGDLSHWQQPTAWSENIDFRS
jgi:hypothetical protein